MYNHRWIHSGKMKVKIYKIQSIVNKELYDKVNATTKKLGVSQGELVREAVLLYLNLLECAQSKQQNKPEPNPLVEHSALLNLMK